MSLINDALKKAQRQRTESPAATAEGNPAGGARIAKRGRALSSNTMVLIGSGALVLIVLSVVITFNLVNEPAKPARPAPAVTPAAAPVTTPAAPVETPAITPPASATTTPAVAPETKAPSSPSVTVPIASLTSPSPATAPAPAATPVAVTAPPPPPVVIAPADLPADERAMAFIETIRVTGIRSFGNESRVLMNERVYRVNDVVERNIGLKLTAVKADSLVFTDPRGKTYTKNF